MADATIDLQASNIFGLNSNFKTVSSGTSTPSTNPTVIDENGNVSCERVIEDITNYTQSARYCGSDFVSDLGTFLTKFGDVQSSKIVTQLTINAAAGEYVTIDITGHNHSENAHAAGLSIGYADVSDFLPHETSPSFESWAAFDGFGVPDFGITLGSNSAPASATVTFSMTHVDETDSLGIHLVGKNITPRCELSMGFTGIPTSATKSALETDLQANVNSMLDAIVDSLDVNDSNSAFDTFAFTAHAHPALATS